MKKLALLGRVLFLAIVMSMLGCVTARECLSPGESEYLPIMKIMPVYPNQALKERIEGWVLVQFTVNKRGKTQDIEVLDSEPKYLFDQAAVESVSQYLYKPRTINCIAQMTYGVKNKISFGIEEVWLLPSAQ